MPTISRLLLPVCLVALGCAPPYAQSEAEHTPAPPQGIDLVAERVNYSISSK